MTYLRSTLNKIHLIKGSYCKFCSLLVVSLLLFTSRLSAQQEQDYDEVNVFLSLPKIGGAELPALIYDEKLYLSITDLFNFLKIKNTASPGFDSVIGFFLSESDSYLIDRVNSKIEYQKRVFSIKEGDILRTETNLYLKASYFGEVFGLECTFNFRSLSVVLNTKIELPVIREIRNEQMRKNINQIRGEIKADTLIGRSYSLFRFGVADWSITSSQKIGGETNNRLSLTLGSTLAGGELNATFNYNNASALSLRDQNYYWRYTNNDFKVFKQIIAGKITTDAVASLNAPIIGVQLTNTPTTYRQSYGTYTLSDVTEPGWLVELFVNNVLIDYKKADASGFFSFEVPLVYGNTGVKLQFYGPWGEERSKEKSINIPYNFLPKGVFEYNLSGGFTEDTLGRVFSRLNMDYGISRSLTVGGGVEFLSSQTSGQFLPFIRSSMRISSRLIISGEYTYGAKLEGTMNYRLPSDFQFEANYVKYDKGQTAINTNYTEERKVSLSVPIRGKNIALFSRLSINQFLMPQSKYTAAELLLSSAFWGANANLTTSAIFSHMLNPDIYSTLSLSMRFPRGFILTPQTQFNYSQGKFTSFKSVLEKRILKNGYVSASYEKDLLNNFTNIDLGIRFDLSFAQLNLNARRDNNTTSFTETASGSIIVDAKNRYIGSSRRPNAGKGGLLIYPYLDINCNGEKDAGEPKVYGLQLHLNGGRVEYNVKDTTIRVFELEPYSKYLLTFSGSSFDNIAWQLKNKIYDVTIEPNQIKKIEIPVSVYGEANGMVYLESNSGQSGQGRIIVDFYSSDSRLVRSTLSEDDGFFSLLGFTPGDYTAVINKDQMEKLNMKSTPGHIKFSISPSRYGDLKEELVFIITKNPVSDSIEKNSVHSKEEILIPKSIISEKKTVDTETYISGRVIYKIQLLASRKKVIIDHHFIKILSEISEINVVENLGEDGLFRYSVELFETLEKAVSVHNKIIRIGWKDSFIIPYYISESRNSPVSEFFSVQILATRNPVIIEELFTTIYNKFPNIIIKENLGKDGYYRYSCGVMNNRTEAEELLKLLRNLGWRDAFIYKK